MVGSDSAVAVDGAFGSIQPVADSLLTVGTLQGLLANSMVTVTTHNPDGLGAGNITVVNPVTWSSDTSLTLRADAAVNVNAPISKTGPGGVLNLIAGGAINVNAQISHGGDFGVVTMNAGTGINLNARVSGMNGSVLAMRTLAGDIVQKAN